MMAMSRWWCKQETCSKYVQVYGRGAEGIVRLSTRDLGSGSDANRESGSKDHFSATRFWIRIRAEFTCCVELTCDHIKFGSGIRIQWIWFHYPCREPQSIVTLQIEATLTMLTLWQCNSTLSFTFISAYCPEVWSHFCRNKLFLLTTCV